MEQHITHKQFRVELDNTHNTRAHLEQNRHQKHGKSSSPCSLGGWWEGLVYRFLVHHHRLSHLLHRDGLPSLISHHPSHHPSHLPSLLVECAGRKLQVGRKEKEKRMNRERRSEFLAFTLLHREVPS